MAGCELEPFSSAGALNAEALQDLQSSLQGEIEALERKLMQCGLSKPAATIYGFSPSVIAQGGMNEAQLSQTAAKPTAAHVAASLDMRIGDGCESDEWDMLLPHEFGAPSPSFAQSARDYERTSSERDGSGNLADVDD